MNKGMHISVLDINQFYTVIGLKNKCFSRVYVDYSIAESVVGELDKYNDIDFYIASPYVVRNDENELLERLLLTHKFKGVLIRNLEIFSFLNTNCVKFKFVKIVLDSNMYVLNHESLNFYLNNSKLELSEFYASLEVNDHENNVLIKNINSKIAESFLVYGRMPMMVSANCLRKTTGKCSHNAAFLSMEDRYQKDFPVFCNCLSCYNIIYNSVVLSLHKQFCELQGKGNVRIDFTTENEKEVSDVILYFEKLKYEYKDPQYTEYTTGHFKRGVE